LKFCFTFNPTIPAIIPHASNNQSCYEVFKYPCKGTEMKGEKYDESKEVDIPDKCSETCE
jgi:hypothetical protein